MVCDGLPHRRKVSRWHLHDPRAKVRPGEVQFDQDKVQYQRWYRVPDVRGCSCAQKEPLPGGGQGLSDDHVQFQPRALVHLREQLVKSQEMHRGGLQVGYAAQSLWPETRGAACHPGEVGTNVLGVGNEHRAVVPDHPHHEQHRDAGCRSGWPNCPPQVWRHQGMPLGRRQCCADPWWTRCYSNRNGSHCRDFPPFLQGAIHLRR
mmetsp:Transcript_36822/g.55599  ORF Transcript_36822/g.55599 Transcript_36822/m.55599 type:complete len:205 (-) Transcript_36822:150-764(-)